MTAQLTPDPSVPLVNRVGQVASEWYRFFSDMSGVVRGVRMVDTGTVTLVAGSVTVTTRYVKADSIILYSVQTAGGTQGHLSVSARTAGQSFTLLSTNAADTSTVSWQIWNRRT